MPRYSLKGRENIQALLNTGKRYLSDRLALYLNRTKPDSNDLFNVAYLISGIAGNAVQRNRVKRWMREDFRQLQMNYKVEGLFAIRLKNSRDIAKTITHPEITNELETIFLSIMADA